MLSSISYKYHSGKNSKILSKVPRKFWDMLEQYQTKQNSLQQSLDSKFNGKKLYFLNMKNANTKNVPRRSS